MKVTISIDNKWLQQKIEERRVEGDADISAQEMMHDIEVGPKLEKFLKEMAEGLLVAHLDGGHDEGVLGTVVFGD